MQISYTLDDARVQWALKQAPEVIATALDRSLNTAAMHVVVAEQEQLRDNDSIVFSSLVSSIAVHKLGRFERLVRPGMQYAPDVENGSRPHIAPIRPLREWLRVRGADNPDRQAYQLRRHIAAHGTRAHPFVAPAYEASRPVVEQIIADGVFDGVREVFEQ